MSRTDIDLLDYLMESIVETYILINNRILFATKHSAIHFEFNFKIEPVFITLGDRF